MTHRFIHAPTLSSIRPRHQHLTHFSTSSTQWFRRFLSPKEEKQLYLGITALFRDKLKEHSTPSNQSYSNIIDQVILGTQSTMPFASKTTDICPTTLTLKQLEQLKQDLDMAGKAKDLEQLETLWDQLKQAGNQIPTTMYNRLIRSCLSCPTPQGLDMATLIVDSMEAQHRLPTTRTCTYMIQAYLKRQLPLDDARPYVAMLQRYSLNKFKTSFDCSVMLRYYIKCGNTHAIDFLWKDMMRHRDTIQPGPSIYTRYAEWLLSTRASLDVMADAAHCFVQQFDTKPGSWTDYQLSVWLKIVLCLAHGNTTAYCMDADKLMLTLVNISNTLPDEHQTTIPPTSGTLGTKTQQAIQGILHTYLAQAQDLKVLAFYYRLRKLGIKEDAFGTDLTRAIGMVLGRVETQPRDPESKAMAEAFGGLLPTHS